MLLFLAMIGHDRLTPQRQNHAIYQYALMTFLTNEKPITFSGFWQEKRMRGKTPNLILGPFTLAKTKIKKNLGVLLYRLHCQKNP